jgi:preprotein translocase subunit SecA
MLGSLTNTLKKLFGDKAEKDLKELKPYATKANVEFDKLTNLSNDELQLLMSSTSKKHCIRKSTN